MTEAERDTGMEGAETDWLVRTWESNNDEIVRLRDRTGHIEWELTRRMRADGATAIPHPDFEIELKSRASYDYGKLAALREVVPQEEIDRAFVAEHEETVTVPDKWNATKALTFKKYGSDAQAILEGARIEGPLRLSIKRKKKAANGET